MPSIFSRIIAGDIPCYKVAEDDRNFAFLDINPVAPGHVLCVPKHEVDNIFDLSEEEYTSLLGFARRIAHAAQKAMPCIKCGMAVIGLEVPHAHVHIIPMKSEHDMDFSKPKLTMAPDELARIAAAIAAKL